MTDTSAPAPDREIAWLGMYDLPSLRGAHDRLWQNTRRKLGYGPARLDRATDPWAAWQSPGLVLGQTCGLPFRARLSRRVALVGAPDHRLPGCPPGFYRSVLVARADDDRDRLADFLSGVFALNDALSQSGWAAPVAHLAGLGHAPPQRILPTGSHAGSAAAVAEGRADFAALDAVTFALLRDAGSQAAARLRVVARTDPSPALPYVTAAGRDPQPLFDALAAAIAALPDDDRAALRLHGVIALPAERYLAQPLPLRPAVS